MEAEGSMSTELLVEPNEVGCRPCSWIVIVRYLVYFAIIIGGFVIIVAAPKVCPGSFQEENCIANGHSYPCKNGSTCANKGPSSGAIIGGLIIIIIASILSCVSCCHQSRCIFPDKHYNNKVCFCC